MTKEDVNFMKTEGLNSIKTALKIYDGYSCWQESYKNLTLEICELYNKNGIACECNADAQKVYYTTDRS